MLIKKKEKEENVKGSMKQMWKNSVIAESGYQLQILM